MSFQVVVLASGGGTTAETIIRAAHSGSVDYQVGHIIVSRPDAGIFERITKLNEELGLAIPCTLIGAKNYPAGEHEVVTPGCQTEAEETAIITKIDAGNYDLVMLLGYMKKVGPKLVSRFGWQANYTSPYQAKMLNTHPGLLPETKGLYGILVQQHVIAQKLPFGGQTLHVVAEDYDEGPIITEHQVAVLEDDTPAQLFARVQRCEKQYIASDIEEFLAARLEYKTHQKEK